MIWLSSMKATKLACLRDPSHGKQGVPEGRQLAVTLQAGQGSCHHCSTLNCFRAQSYHMHDSAMQATYEHAQTTPAYTRLLTCSCIVRSLRPGIIAIRLPACWCLTLLLISALPWIGRLIEISILWGRRPDRAPHIAIDLY